MTAVTSVSVDQMREVDRLTTGEVGISLLMLGGDTRGGGSWFWPDHP